MGDDVEENERRWRAVGAEIKAAREAKGWTGREAERMSKGRITQAKLSQAETAKRKYINRDELQAYAELFDMDLNTLALMAYGADMPPAGAALRHSS
jgi:transcriptional regulator with XRE-family HTH domain